MAFFLSLCSGWDWSLWEDSARLSIVARGSGMWAIDGAGEVKSNSKRSVEW